MHKYGLGYAKLQLAIKYMPTLHGDEMTPEMVDKVSGDRFTAAGQTFTANP